jgi:carotenoid 1,2-hydratase
MNVALYRAGRDRWAMTERGRSSLVRARDSLAIGPSHMVWDGDELRLSIDEWTAPLPSRLRGTVRLRPHALAVQSYALDQDNRHHWAPIAPHARVEVAFDRGDSTWSGDAYFDCNWGSEPLERGFRNWQWSRAHTRAATHVHYDVTTRTGDAKGLALRFDHLGGVSTIEQPPRASLPPTFWGISRAARGQGPIAPRLVRTLEDAPFYARSQLECVIDGEAAAIMHESLSLNRFRSPVVRAMLPFRMPRIVRRQ